MMAKKSVSALLTPLMWPALAWAAYLLHYSITASWFNLILLFALIVSILQAVHHAEVIAHGVGEPFGTLVLALAVTCIEASLIISLMSASGPDGATLARDTVFAAVMIILTGMIGMSLLVGGVKYGEQSFVLEGSNAIITTIVAISVLTLILPNFTTSIPGPFYNAKQLIFVAIVTLVLYGSLLFVQNFKHRQFFLDPGEVQDEHPHSVTRKQAWMSLVLMMVCLLAVVLLTKSLSPTLDAFIVTYGAPQELAGVIIAAVILIPEGLSAYRASTRNQLQKSLNLSLGSALASISLTMPIVSLYAVWTRTPIILGIDPSSTILFLLTLFILVLSLKTGKTTILQGIILLVIFCVYLFTILVP